MWPSASPFFAASAGRRVLLTQTIPHFVMYAVGTYLFYAQHNFPDVSFNEKAGWTYEKAALESSSYLRTGQVMAWFTGNIGYHHVHHLNAKIPFYRLPEVMAAMPELQAPKTTSFHPSEIVRCLRLKVWDVTAQRMVGLPELPPNPLMKTRLSQRGEVAQSRPRRSRSATAQTLLTGIAAAENAGCGRPDVCRYAGAFRRGGKKRSGGDSGLGKFRFDGQSVDPCCQRPGGGGAPAPDFLSRPSPSRRALIPPRGSLPRRRLIRPRTLDPIASLARTCGSARARCSWAETTSATRRAWARTFACSPTSCSTRRTVSATA